MIRHKQWVQLACCALMLLAIGFAPAAAELYKWTDENGVLRVTQDLGDVPARHRSEALRSAQSRSRIQTYSTSDGSAISPPASVRSGSGMGAIRVPFELHGTIMAVQVRLNDRVTAPFIVDTGASHISIPHEVAAQLGIRIDSRTPRRTAMTANGQISEPVVTLNSVQLGDARVEHLEASVSGSMKIGLLGGIFFNNYIYQIDIAKKEILLKPNHEVASGLTQDQWRARFIAVREPLGRLETVLDRGDFSDHTRQRDLEARREHLRAQLEELESQANRSHVPQNWRR